MPNWTQIAEQLKQPTEILNSLRSKYINLMIEYTGRNVITYYSSFMQIPSIAGTEINDNDKNAFMQMVAGIPREKRSAGLDLILHTPGGDIAATESLVHYLKSIFGNDIRVIVPQSAMSAGTMIALSSKEIIMGKQSNLGPIDPQFGGISCYGVVEEFQRAISDIQKNPAAAQVWANIICKYHPTFLGECEKAITWSKTIVTDWLKSNMFEKDSDKDSKIEKIVEKLSSHEETFSHNRHIPMDDLISWGVKITPLESFPKVNKAEFEDFQDCVLTLHHVYMQTISSGMGILKIIENGKNTMIMTANVGGLK